MSEKLMLQVFLFDSLLPICHGFFDFFDCIFRSYINRTGSTAGAFDDVVLLEFFDNAGSYFSALRAADTNAFVVNV